MSETRTIQTRLYSIEEKLDSLSSQLRDNYFTKLEAQLMESKQDSKIVSISDRLKVVEKFAYGVLTIMGSSVILAIFNMILK